MKAKIIFVVFILVLFLSCTEKKMEIHGSTLGYLGIEKDNTLNIYRFIDEWVEIPDHSFSLHRGDKIVYFDIGLMVIQRRNELKFYYYNDGWVDAEGTFPLPTGYKNILYNRYTSDIHLVNDNSLKTCKFSHRHWEEMTEINFPLPQNHGDMLLFSWLGTVSLGVAENGSLNFHELDGSGISKRIAGFTLPNGYKKIIPNYQGIGVVENDVIKFYKLSPDNIENQKWLESADMDFFIK